MPKAKADQVIVHRIELQETERDALELLVTSMAVKNITTAGSSFVSAFTRATWSGAILWGSVAALIAIELEALAPGALFPGTVGQLGANAELRAFYPRMDDETASQYRRRTTLADRLKYGFWDKPVGEIQDFINHGTPIPT